MQVLFDDEDWKTVKVQAFDLVLTRHKRIQIQPLSGGIEFLLRWLLRADLRTHVVDHISGNVYDHRRKSLRVVDASSNGQNARLPRRNERGYIGVYLLTNKTYRATCYVQGEYRTIGRNSAAHEYDLVSLYQQGSDVLVNRLDMVHAPWRQLIERMVRLKKRLDPFQSSYQISRPRGYGFTLIRAGGIGRHTAKRTRRKEYRFFWH